MQCSNLFNELKVRAKRIVRTAATFVTLSTVALSAQAANIYGPPGLQPNQIGGGSTAYSYAAVSADFNNDGYADLAVINKNTGNLAVYTANAIGTLTLSHDYGIFNLDSPNAIVAGDVNGDGKIDLVITDQSGVSVLLGVGDVTAGFTAASPQRPALADADRGATGAMLADLNHDGKLDIVVGVYESGDFGGTHYFEVLQGIGGGKFILVGQYEVPYSGSGSAYFPGAESQLADIDGDGERDIVFKNSVIGAGVSWMKGLGNGQFLAAAPLATVGSGVGDWSSIAAIDVDGDGKVDLLMLNSYGKGVWMAKGNGDSTFQALTHLYATGIPSNGARDMGPIVVADVNGDGRLDIVADGYVLLQQANHSFVFNEHIGYSQTNMLTAIDLNHDGRADLITAGPGAGKIAIFTSLGAGAPNSVLATGTPQSTVFNTAFAQALSIKVIDGSNAPVPNVLVLFSQVPAGGVATASVFSGTTNAQGIVSYIPTANGGLGCYQMKASITGLSVTPFFDLCNTGANSLTVTATSDNQSTLVNTAFPIQLQVKLTDTANNPKSGVTVSFGGPSSASRATLSSPTAVTNAAGFAAVNATATAISGAYSVSVTAPGATPTSIKLSNSAAAGSASSIAFDVSTPQYAYVTKAFAAPIVAHITDFFSNPVAGATVVFKITPDSLTGATASFSSLTAVTDASGDAQVTATANGFIGAYSVKASIQGNVQAPPANFLLKNYADLPKFMTLTSGTPQTTQVNTAFAQKLRVQVTAWDGTPTPQVRVYFLENGGVTLSAGSALADANGFAEVTATADGSVGAHQVGAIVYDTVVETPITQVFTLTNTAATTLTISNASIAEGNAGTKVLNFPVTLDAVSPVDVVITYSTTDGTATTANNDYVAVTNGTVTIPAGQLTGSLPVTINGDTTIEPDETFMVTISSATNATLGTASATGTIMNDDTLVPLAPIIPVPVNHPLALFALMLALLGFAWRRSARQL
ncbi:MAG: FG-GAP-like repeat-containing protein [Casimicrobium sp.]